MVTPYLDELFAKSVLSAVEAARLRSTRNRYEQASRFLETLMLKGEEKIGMFLEMVKNGVDKQPHIYDILLAGDGNSRAGISRGGQSPGDSQACASSGGNLQLVKQTTPELSNQASYTAHVDAYQI